MKKLKYFIILLCFCLFLSGCTSTEEISETPQSTPLLLEATKDGVENKIYLFGSIHAADEELYPLPDYVEESYKNSDVLAVEFDLISFSKDLSKQMFMLSSFVYTDKRTIKDDISEELYEKVKEILIESGLYSTLYDMYKPIMWYTLLESATIHDAELDSNKGIDNHFLNQAHEDDKEILELESAEYQYNMLSDLNLDLQIYLLESSINNYEASKIGLKVLYELYKKGNKEDLEQLLITEEETDEYTRDFNNELITVRNKNMADALIKEYENGKDIFCTVGLLHIIGEDGIADLLEKNGFKVTIKH